MTTPSDILTALRDVLDPEMPINIVDLGLVERVDLRSVGGPPSGLADAGAAGSEAHVAVSIELLPTFVGCPALPLLESLVRQRIAALPGVAEISVRFVYDPPWSVERISAAGREALRRHGVTVPQRGLGAAQRGSGGPATASVTLTVSGRPAAPAAPPDAPPADVVPCPFCGDVRTTLESRFGPTRCRMIYYCPACRNSFEHMKPI